MSRLRRLLLGFPQDIEIAGEATDGPSAAAAIRAQTPDLVFLDIQLPGCNGFQVLQEVERQPAVIFTTAFREHALDAFNTRVVDYLLKPIDADAIAKALAKLHAFNDDQVGRTSTDPATSSASRYPVRLPCREGERITLVKLGEILYFQSDTKYTRVQTANRDYLIDTPLIELERKLDPRDFIRIHRATIVNVSWIAELRRSYDGRVAVLLADAKSTELAVSRHYQGNLTDLTNL